MLADHEIHLWFSSILKSKTARNNLYRTLSLDEREKAARFQFDEHRNAYIVAHGLLRSVLSYYVRIKPEELQFTYGAKGKPALCGNPIYFNMAHSKDMAVYAVAREPKLGVDVEFIRPISEMESIAKQFFSSVEYDNLLALDPSERNEGFFNCWTRKEAYVKAIGAGLYAPLDQFQVTLTPRQPAAFVTIQADRSLASEWSLLDLKPSEQYAGALAIYGTGWYTTEKPVTCVYLVD